MMVCFRSLPGSGGFWRSEQLRLPYLSPFASMAVLLLCVLPSSGCMLPQPFCIRTLHSPVGLSLYPPVLVLSTPLNRGAIVPAVHHWIDAAVSWSLQCSSHHYRMACDPPGNVSIICSGVLLQLPGLGLAAWLLCLSQYVPVCVCVCVRLSVCVSEDWPAFWSTVRAECDVGPISKGPTKSAAERKQSRVRKVATLARSKRTWAGLGCRQKCPASPNHSADCARNHVHH